MRLLCPLCQKVVSIPDSDAGKVASCPECHKNFQAPSPFVDAPEEPPVYSVAAAAKNPPVYPDMPKPNNPEVTAAISRIDVLAPTPETSGEGPAAPHLSSVQVSPHGGSWHSFPITPAACRWVVRVGLTLPLLLGLFAWVKSAPLSHTAYSQNAWQAFFATMSVDDVAEETLGWKADLLQSLKTSWWLLPFGIALTLGAILSWSEIVMAKWKPHLPPPVELLLAQRERALAVAAAAAFLFLAVQSALGLSLENAAISVAETRNAEARKAATTPEKVKIAEFKIGRDLGAFQVETTAIYGLTRICLLVAAVGVGLSLWLERRGKLPEPRVGAMW